VCESELSVGVEEHVIGDSEEVIKVCRDVQVSAGVRNSLNKFNKCDIILDTGAGESLLISSL